MSREEWIKTGGIAAGLLGLGLLAYLLLKKKASPQSSTRPRPGVDARISNLPVRDASVRDNPVRDASVRDLPVRDLPVRDTPVRDLPVRDHTRRPAPTPEKAKRDEPPDKASDRVVERDVPVCLPPPPKEQTSPQEEPMNRHERTAPLQAPTDAFPLRLGSSGSRVERLQVWLMRNFGVFGKISGSFDEPTQQLLFRHLGIREVSKKTYHRYKMGNHVTEQVTIR